MLVISSCVVLAIAAGLVFRTVQMWRSPSSISLEPPARWPVGPIYWRGVNRAMAVFSFTALTLGLIGVLSVSGYASSLRTALAFLWFAGICLVVFVLAVNRPKFLVPPALRGLPGAFAEERLQRSGTRP